jgi:hypothetical protein
MTTKRLRIFRTFSSPLRLTKAVVWLLSHIISHCATTVWSALQVWSLHSQTNKRKVFWTAKRTFIMTQWIITQVSTRILPRYSLPFFVSRVSMRLLLLPCKMSLRISRLARVWTNVSSLKEWWTSQYLTLRSSKLRLVLREWFIKF